MRENRKIKKLITLVISLLLLVILIKLNMKFLKSNISVTYKQNRTEQENLVKVQETTIINKKAGEVVKTQDNKNYVSDGEGNVIPVPIGFSYLEGTKETGFVIKNDVDLNEFVWVPTDLVKYETAYEEDVAITLKSCKEYYTQNEQENENIIKEITKSVNTNKGFYIGRYEAGTTTKRRDKTKLLVPIFQATSKEKTVYAYNYITWEDAINLSNNLYSKEQNNVTSRLINSRGWDTTLKFIESIGKDANKQYAKHSENKGWYSENRQSNINYETGKPLNENISNKLKNIYDMAGNVCEWTADIYIYETQFRVLRGGFNYLPEEDIPAGYCDLDYADRTEPYKGFRVVLYL